MKQVKSRMYGLVLAIALAGIGILLSACVETDVVAQFGQSSFASLVGRLGSQVLVADGAYRMGVSSAAELTIVRRTPGTAQRLQLNLAAAPFVEAGLDTSRLLDQPGLRFEVAGERLLLHFEWPAPAGARGGAPEAAQGADSAVADYFNYLVGAHRERLGYHAQFDHYGLDLGAGMMFEWAKDTQANDKDVVFVLEPAPLVAAGLVPERVQGWVFAPVEMMAADGSKVTVQKLLRIYDL
jgi:hypothetical protein